jgi:hypothetical protein
VAISTGLSSAGKKVGKAYGTNCDKTQKWQVGDYMIQEYSCIGFAGPHFNRLDIFKNNQLIAENIYNSDSCKIDFQQKNDLYIKINVCNNQVLELQPDKLKLLPSTIDSIIIFSKSAGKSKKLTNKQFKELLNDWGQCKVLDYRDKELDSLFYPTYHYKVSFYNKGKPHELLTFNHLIADKSRWVYEISKYPDTLYFKRLWNNK